MESLVSSGEDVDFGGWEMVGLVVWLEPPAGDPQGQFPFVEGECWNWQQTIIVFSLYLYNASCQIDSCQFDGLYC